MINCIYIGVKILEIAAGGFHSACIGDDGRVYAWVRDLLLLVRRLLTQL